MLIRQSSADNLDFDFVEPQTLNIVQLCTIRRSTTITITIKRCKFATKHHNHG